MSNEKFIQKDLLKSDEYFISTNYSNDFSFSNQLNLDLFEKNYLQRVASDPVMFQKDKTYFNLPYNNDEYDTISMQTSTMSLPNRSSHSFVEIPTNDNDSFIYQRSLPHLKNNQKHLFHTEKYITVNQPKIIPTNSIQTK
jgi:hypothetical protein